MKRTDVTGRAVLWASALMCAVVPWTRAATISWTNTASYGKWSGVGIWSVATNVPPGTGPSNDYVNLNPTILGDVVMDMDVDMSGGGGCSWINLTPAGTGRATLLQTNANTMLKATQQLGVADRGVYRFVRGSTDLAKLLLSGNTTNTLIEIGDPAGGNSATCSVKVVAWGADDQLRGRLCVNAGATLSVTGTAANANILSGGRIDIRTGGTLRCDAEIRLGGNSNTAITVYEDGDVTLAGASANLSLSSYYNVPTSDPTNRPYSSWYLRGGTLSVGGYLGCGASASYFYSHGRFYMSGGTLVCSGGLLINNLAASGIDAVADFSGGNVTIGGSVRVRTGGVYRVTGAAISGIAVGGGFTNEPTSTLVFTVSNSALRITSVASKALMNGTIHMGAVSGTTNGTYDVLTATSIGGAVTNSNVLAAGDETVWSLAVVDGGNGKILRATYSGVPLTDVSVSASDPAAAETGPDPGEFTVARTGSTASNLTVNYTIGGTAATNDYAETLSGQVTIPAGSSQTTIAVTPVDDAVVESNESVTINIATGSHYNVVAPSNATITIVDNDSASAEVSIVATLSNAAEAGPVAGQFEVTRTGSTASNLTVNYTVGGTASTNDYAETLGGQVTLPAGASNGTVAITPVDDANAELNESVTLTLAPGAGYTVGTPNSATVTIADNDLPVVTLTASGPLAYEGTFAPGTFTVQRSGGAGDLTVRYTVSGSASTNDYAPVLTGSVIIPDGTNAQSFAVTPSFDTVAEDDESVILALSNSVTYLVGTPSTAAVIIVDNDDTSVSWPAGAGSGAWSQVAKWAALPSTNKAPGMRLQAREYSALNQAYAADITVDMDVNMSANAGCTYVVVGSSGAGTVTLLQTNAASYLKANTQLGVSGKGVYRFLRGTTDLATLALAGNTTNALIDIGDPAGGNSATCSVTAITWGAANQTCGVLRINAGAALNVVGTGGSEISGGQILVGTGGVLSCSSFLRLAGQSASNTLTEVYQDGDVALTGSGTDLVLGGYHNAPTSDPANRPRSVWYLRGGTLTVGRALYCGGSQYGYSHGRLSVSGGALHCTGGVFVNDLADPGNEALMDISSGSVTIGGSVRIRTGGVYRVTGAGVSGITVGGGFTNEPTSTLVFTISNAALRVTSVSGSALLNGAIDMEAGRGTPNGSYDLITAPMISGTSTGSTALVSGQDSVWSLAVVNGGNGKILRATFRGAHDGTVYTLR